MTFPLLISGLFLFALGGLVGVFGGFFYSDRLRKGKAAENAAENAAREQALRAQFEAAASRALNANNQSFLELAKLSFRQLETESRHTLDNKEQRIDALVRPLQDSLAKMDQKIEGLERHRVGAYEALREQVRGLMEGQVQLSKETGNLVKALRSPVTRGRWGEIQLRRVVEMAGMLSYCDFYEQQSTTTERGVQRPDMLVRLPGGKTIVVDAKTPLAGYLSAIEAQDEPTRLMHLRSHAEHVRKHVRQLGEKSYWEQFTNAPELVVMFLPGEMFFSAALEQDPELIEFGVEQKVIVATPTTLIALLRAISYGWRQEGLEQNAREIGVLGRELYKRMATFSGYMTDLGRGLGSAVGSYNKAVSNLESRLLVTTRRFRDLHSGGEEPIEGPAVIDRVPQLPSDPELRQGALPE